MLEHTHVKTHYWAWPDIFRAVAALLVCAGHLRAALFIDYGDIKNPGLLDKIFYFLTSLGHESVIIFFVLSGFLVGGSILDKKDSFDWKLYFIARITRLMIVLAPALLLTYFVDAWISSLSPTVLTGGLQKAWNSVPAPGVYSNSLITLLGNVVFLQTIAVPVFGTNAPLWSLANEFWYYVAFPLIGISFGLIKTEREIKARFFYAIIIFLFFFWLPSSFLEGLVVWVMGVFTWLACRQKNGSLSHRYSTTIAFLVFLAALAYSKLDHLGSYFFLPPDIALGISFSLLLATLHHKKNQPNLKSLFGRALNKLSNISYSLYLTHFPLVILIAIYADTDKTQLTPSLFSFLFFIASILTLIAAGYCMWWISERHTNSIRKMLNNLPTFIQK